VKSPKTERHAGHAERLIPLFPELLGPLHEAFDQAAEGAEFVLPFLHRISSAALRDPMHAAIRRAGLTPWARLWHNLRSSRQTELEGRFPSHVVCSWLGNSQAVARRHYLQVRETDFEKAVQNPVQQEQESGCTQEQGSQFIMQKTPANAGAFASVQLGADALSDPDGI
jgi:hypothetical protein